MTLPTIPELSAAAAAALGAELRAAGLTAAALAAWAGTARISALPPRLPALAARPATRAATALRACVLGERAPLAGLAVLPLGRALLVCDRSDAHAATELLCWPDDSSYHLAGALPAGRRARWLDLGAGSGFAPLLRPELATAIDAVDLSARACAAIRLGAALSGIQHVRAWCADLAAAPDGPYDLITCNAPIPDAPSPALWQHADAGLFARLWAAARARVAPGGWIIVHGALAELRAAPAIGAQTILAYTPPDAERGFGCLWWRPDAPTRRDERARLLTAERPHVDPSDHPPDHPA